MILKDIRVTSPGKGDGSYQVREVMENNVPVLTVGRGSYITSGSIQNDLPVNLHIGQFCSLETNITFLLQMDKDNGRISTSNNLLIAPLPNVLWRTSHPIKGQIILQNDIWVGSNTTIMGGVTVHNGAIISANSHVAEDVPPYAIVGGNPAKVLKYRFTDEQIADLLDIAWWDWSDQLLMERKPDFSWPVQAFIDKYKSVPDVFRWEKDIQEKRFLLFPDFDKPYPLWKRIVREYCEKCCQGARIGQLFLYMPEDSRTDRHIKELTEFLNEHDDSSGDIYVQVGQIADERELFAVSDYLVTSRVDEIVHYTCIADKFGLPVLSGADLPDVFWEQQSHRG